MYHFKCKEEKTVRYKKASSLRRKYELKLISTLVVVRNCELFEIV